MEIKYFEFHDMGGITIIFFDIDDTLIDHTSASERAINTVYLKYSDIIQIKEELFKERWMELANYYFQAFLHNRISFEMRLTYIVSTLFSLKGDDDILNNIIQYYLDAYENSWNLYMDVYSCLNKLKGHRLGIISNGSAEQQKRKLKKCGIFQYFDTIIISEEYRIAKPDLRLFELACSKAGTEEKKCICIGNSLEHDVLPFNKLGGYGIWIDRNHSSSNHLSIIQVNSLNDIPQLADMYLR